MEPSEATGVSSTRAGEKVRRALFGAALVFVGIVVVEVLTYLGAVPLTPVGWPSLGAILAAALAGVSALVGGAVTLVGYALFNLLQPERFADFFSEPTRIGSWVVGVSLLCGGALFVRPRLVRLAAAEAELVARRRYEAALLASEEQARVAKERLEMALDGSNVVLFDTDLRTGRVYLSEAWSRIVGEDDADTVTTVSDLLGLVHPEEREAVRRTSIEVLKGARQAYGVEHRVKTKQGEWRWLISRGRVTERDPQSGRALRMIGTNVDITDRKRMEEAAQSAAQSDPLTGLANRRAFHDSLRMALARSRRSGNDIAVLYLDLDRFKQVNDKFGHAAGDRLLRHVALRLRGCVRQSDTVARFGGDEFVVLLEDLRDREHAVAVVEKIIDEMRRPLNLEGFEVSVTTSIGLAYAQAGAEPETLVKRADKALYEAKAAGRDCFSVG
jgi:diguanylate cyclase (GGDEF)-like protein/PAS domain S-box-containing protein